MKQEGGIHFVRSVMRLGGAERFMLDMALTLQSAGWDTRIWVSEHHVTQTFPDALNGAVPIHATSSWIPPAFAGRPRRGLMLARLRGQLERIAKLPGTPRLFVVDDPEHIAAWIRRRWPHVPVLWHCNYPNTLPPPAHALHRWYRNRLDRLQAAAVAAVNEITAISGFSRTAIQRTWPRFASWPVPVLYPGVELPSVPEPPPFQSDRTILCVSRLDPSKRPDLAIAAFGHLRSLLPAAEFARCRLMMAGGLDTRLGLSGYPETLRQLAAAAGVATQVELHPNISRPQLDKLWAGAFAFMHTAPEEHFGIALVEAMARALPVLAVDAAGPKEIVVNGTTGALRPAAPEAFASVLAEWLQHPATARQAGQAGRTRAAERFSRAHFRRTLLALAAPLLMPAD